MSMQRRSVVLASVCLAVIVALAALTGIAAVVTDDASDAQLAAADARFTANLDRTPGDVDGDGRTDLVVYRPATATFWIDQSSGDDLAVPLGATGDTPTSGDFDGDGRADLVAVRSGTADGSGSWLIRSASDGGQRSISFGLAGDIPTPGDYDGDGLDDVAVFRPASSDTANATWFVLRSSTGALDAVPFGITGDLPAAADHDGDGITDPAVQRGDTRWILQSTDGATIARQFGRAGDRPVAIDRAGDGAVDLAVVHDEGENQTWYVSSAASGSGDITTIVFGRATAPYQQRFVGDFDGDGRTEPAVFDPSISAFWIWSPTGITTVSWGTPDDLVLPLGVDPRVDPGGAPTPSSGDAPG